MSGLATGPRPPDGVLIRALSHEMLITSFLRDNTHMRFQFCAGIFALAGIGLAADVHVVEEIVAKVNGDIITRTELEHTRQEIEAGLRQQGLSGAALEKAVKERSSDALRDQIDQLLLVQKGKDLNINVDPEWRREILPVLVRRAFLRAAQ